MVPVDFTLVEEWSHRSNADVEFYLYHSQMRVSYDAAQLLVLLLVSVVL